MTINGVNNTGQAGGATEAGFGAAAKTAKKKTQDLLPHIPAFGGDGFHGIGKNKPTVSGGGNWKNKLALGVAAGLLLFMIMRLLQGAFGLFKFANDVIPNDTSSWKSKKAGVAD